MATDETEKLRRTIEALRSELRSRGAGSPGILDDLLVEGPIPIPVPPLPKVTVNEEAESHHRHPLPFLVLDDEGKPERVVIPHGAGMGGEMGNDPHDDPGHEHGHSEPKPPKRK